MTKTASDGPTAWRGRISAAREQELFDSVISMLREVGYEALTIERLAIATKSSKATFYRRWSGKPELVAAAIRSMRRVETMSIDTGGLAGDLHALVDRLGGLVRRDAELMNSVAHAVSRDPNLAKAVRETFVEPDAASLNAMVERAVSRGEMSTGNPAGRLIQHLMLGALLSRFILDEIEVDLPFLHEFVDSAVIPALTWNERSQP